MPSAPKVLGREAEGTILSTGPGDLHNLKIGDQIVWLAMGGYAEYTAVPTSTAFKIPSDVKPGVAAAATLQGLTALVLTHEVYSVQKDDWVLVHAAAGGVGLWLCQVLKAVGANTIGTASTADKIKLAKENGAGWMINYKEETDLVQKVMEITNGKGVDVVYDSVGKDQAENSLEVLKKNGVLVNYGASVS
jgi:NADPH2:quinone reductase